MSQSLFIVEARSDFSPFISERRIVGPYVHRTKTPLPRRAFFDRAGAERWALENMPTDLNPFECCSYDEEDDTLYLLFWESEDGNEEEYSVSISELGLCIEGIGLTPPRLYARWSSGERWSGGDWWRDWWGGQAAILTPIRRAELWRRLIPQPWRITEVEADL